MFIELGANVHANRVLIVMVSVGFLCAIEYFIAKRMKLNSFDSKSMLANFWIIFINGNLNFILTGIIVFNTLTYAYQHGAHLTSNMNTYVYWGLLFVIQDFADYWQHRYLHLCRWGWASHVTHHTSSTFNLSIPLLKMELCSILGYNAHFMK